MGSEDFHKQILQGIPDTLPPAKDYNATINHAPKRKDILNADEKILAVKNALRYFPQKLHATLLKNLQKN